MTGSKAKGGLVLALMFAALPVEAQAPQSQAVPPPPTVTLDFGSLSGTLQQGVITGADGKPVTLNYGNELTVQADKITGDLLHQDYEASGHVRAHAEDTTLSGDVLHVNGAQGTAAAARAMLVRPPYTIRAEQIQVEPKTIRALNGNFTTASPDESPDYEIRVKTLQVLEKQHKIVMRNAALYLFHNHIITLPRLQFKYGGAGGTGASQQRQQLKPAFGYSGRYGVFAALNGTVGKPLQVHYNAVAGSRRYLQVQFLSSQALLLGPAIRPEAPLLPPPPTPAHDYLGALRALTTTERRPLPAGDPLLFHDFLPDANPIRLFDAPPREGVFSQEEVSFHLPSSGRGRNDLYVTRLPEVSLTGILPLTHLYSRPETNDPVAFRRYLSRVGVYFAVQGTEGFYQEQPTGIHRIRQRYTALLSTVPIMIASNTALVTNLSSTTNRYRNTDRQYRYNQFSIALNHYYSNYSAIGLQYVTSGSSGDSPFNFDVLDTTSELDGRMQIGNRRLAVAGSARYDLNRHRVLDYKISIAPGLHGFTPVFTYDFFDRSVGFGFEIPGLTF